MFEEFQPKVKIGALKPLAVIDNAAYEFYRIAIAEVSGPGRTRRHRG